MWTAEVTAWRPVVGMWFLLLSCPAVCPGCCRLLQQTHTSGWALGPLLSARTRQILLVPLKIQSQAYGHTPGHTRQQICIRLRLETLPCKKQSVPYFQFQVGCSLPGALSGQCPQLRGRRVGTNTPGEKQKKKQKDEKEEQLC